MNFTTANKRLWWILKRNWTWFGAPQRTDEPRVSDTLCPWRLMHIHEHGGTGHLRTAMLGTEGPTFTGTSDLWLSELSSHGGFPSTKDMVVLSGEAHPDT